MLTSPAVRVWPAAPYLAAWLALIAGLVLRGDIYDGASFVLESALGAAAVSLGFTAAAACRRLSPATHRERLPRAGVASAAGILFGAANLVANWLIASRHPTLHALLVRRFAAIDAVQAVIAAPLAEEVMVRLFLMSAIAWIAWRVTKRCSWAFWIALVASSLLFASMHLARPFPGEPELVAFYRASLLVKYTLAGLPMGWLFWRRGLPYAILCHAFVNATHIVLEPFAF